MWDNRIVVDADGHVMEPASMWQDYIEPEFRDRALRIERDAIDGDKLIIDGRPSQLIRRLGGVRPSGDGKVVDWNSLVAGDYAPYQESCLPASYDGNQRLRWLETNAIDSTYLFPSLGLIWPREIDPHSPYAAAHFRAYNRWLADFAGAAPGRLVPVGQAALDGPVSPAGQVAALAEFGYADVMLPHGTADLRSRQFDEFCAAVQEHRMTIHLHKVAIPHFLPVGSPTSLKVAGMGSFFNHVNEILPGQLCLAAILDAGLPDRFPGCRFAFHECNAGWLPGWLDRAEESYDMLIDYGQSRPDRRPRDYFTGWDGFFFSIGLGENPAELPSYLWSRLLIATDFPHPGTPAQPQAEWSDALSDAPEQLVTALLGENARRMARADTPVGAAAGANTEEVRV